MDDKRTGRATGAESIEEGVVQGRDRRSVLRAGAIGAAWVVPAVTMIGVSPAHADNPSGPPVVTEPPTVEPTKKPSVEPSVESTSETSTSPAVVRTTPPPAGTQAAPVRAAAFSTQASAPQSLAFTGVETGVAAAVAAGLVIGGTALTVASRQGKEPGEHQA